VMPSELLAELSTLAEPEGKGGVTGGRKGPPESAA
jgi:hypothetical protein